MKKVIIFLFAILLLLAISCSSPLESKYGSKYGGKMYNTSKDNQENGGIVSPPEDPGFEEEVVDPATDPFNENIAGNPTPNDGGYNASKFEEWRIVAGFDGKNVPEYKFSGTGWNIKDASKHEYTYAGANSYAGGNSITGMTYYQYRGYNYFYERDAPGTPYHKMENNGHGNRIKRFYFYRFSGKGGGVASLDNLLMAVDSYSKLIYGYGKPLSYTSILGNQMPTSWGVFDLYSSGPGGKKYKFYEYDPIGYVKADGSVVLYDWFKERQGTGNYESYMAGGPDRVSASFNGPGKSPYITEASAGSVNLDPVVGTLTVEALYFKNVSVTDSLSDALDSSTRPEFLFNVRSSIYTGFDSPSYVNMANYKSKETSSMPANAYGIDKGKTVLLSSVKGIDYNINSETFGKLNEDTGDFEGVKKEMYLAIDMRILEVDVFANTWVADYEMPLITLKYDRDKKSWVIVGDNGLYYNGKQKIYYDKDFTVRKSQTKTLSILLDADSSDSPQRVEVGVKISFD